MRPKREERGGERAVCQPRRCASAGRAAGASTAWLHCLQGWRCQCRPHATRHAPRAGRLLLLLLLPALVPGPAPTRLPPHPATASANPAIAKCQSPQPPPARPTCCTPRNAGLGAAGAGVAPPPAPLLAPAAAGPPAPLAPPPLPEAPAPAAAAAAAASVSVLYRCMLACGKLSLGSQEGPKCLRAAMSQAWAASVSLSKYPAGVAAAGGGDPGQPRGTRVDGVCPALPRGQRWQSAWLVSPVPSYSW